MVIDFIIVELQYVLPVTILVILVQVNLIHNVLLANLVNTELSIVADALVMKDIMMMEVIVFATTAIELVKLVLLIVIHHV